MHPGGGGGGGRRVDAAGCADPAIWAELVHQEENYVKLIARHDLLRPRVGQRNAGAVGLDRKEHFGPRRGQFRRRDDRRDHARTRFCGRDTDLADLHVIGPGFLDGFYAS